MEFEKSSIERLKRTLYSRNENLVPKERRTPVSGSGPDVRTDWGDDTSFAMPAEIEMSRKHNNAFFNKFLLWSLGFFLVALGIAAFIFFGGINLISSNNLDVKIIAPSSISSGEELDMGVSVVNQNRTELEEVYLFIDYPEGSKTVGTDSKTIARDKISLNTIPAGAMSDHTIRSLLFGEKDAVKTFTLRIEYKVKGSNAIFSKEKTYDVIIGSSPLLLNTTFPKEINSGDSITFSIEIQSNSPVLVQNTLVKVEYPYGFTYKDSNIKPLRDKSTWDIGDLKSGDKKTIAISGTLVGQNMEDRTFKVSAGTKNILSPSDLDSTLATAISTVGIRKSFFDLVVTPSELAPTFGSPVQISVRWQNTLPDKIINSRIEASLSGNAFDRNSVSTGGKGFYRSTDNTILWDKNNTNDLESISPGDDSELSFSLSSFSSAVQARSIKNPHINIRFVMTGERAGIDSGEVSSSQDVTIKILTSLSMAARSFRDAGPLNNTGPIPPRADRETTYTVTWTLTNTTNDLKDAVVTGVLPSGVEWKGTTSPDGESVSYNTDNRTVTWNAGSISAGAGFTYSPKEVSFKVGLTPSVSQIGSAPTLVSQISANATDSYVEAPISVTANAVNTRYSDASFVQGRDVVGK